MFKLAKLAKRIKPDNTIQAGLPPDSDALKSQVIEAIKSVYDPEIPLNIYDLGLIYEINIDDQKHVDVKMTLTAPACPVAGILPGQVRDAISLVNGINDVNVELVWDPPWSQDSMTDEAKLELGIL